MQMGNDWQAEDTGLKCWNYTQWLPKSPGYNPVIWHFHWICTEKDTFRSVDQGACFLPWYLEREPKGHTWKQGTGFCKLSSNFRKCAVAQEPRPHNE